ncbi:hypothetical protein PN465_05285 [Nodularia spumigena CS-584]|nr:hypothetical protein [Nodularia spumigena]AHJ29076.1 hypothetical protein NSP_27480 [Nodularia spumigena CCY9414]MDB9381642.1 hypothetical protein [Nodularia spumigena CS-584]MEA5557052.1 hypothetical protein [Nodularia spumigena CH309]
MSCGMGILPVLMAIASQNLQIADDGKIIVADLCYIKHRQN